MKSLAASLSLLALLAPSQVFATDLAVDGTTLLRFEERTAPGFSNQRIIPATQYLGMDLSGIGGTPLSLHLYGWGRLDLADRSGESENPRSTDGNFTYGYLMYRFPSANARIKAGRFFVYEGVAAEQVDGIYARTDLNKGFTLAVFGGIPVALDRSGDKGDTKGDYIGGGRLGYRYGGIIDIGLSGLQEGNSPVPSGKGERQLAGIDAWLSPHRMVEITGRASYNGTTESIAEQAYILNLRPLSTLTATASYTEMRPKDYFTFTNLPSLFNPTANENHKAYGLGVNYRFTALKMPAEIDVAWKNYRIESKGNSDRFGGEIRVGLSEKLKSGISFAHIAAADGIMSYNEARMFCLYNYGKFGAHIDVIGNFYENDVYGKKNAFEVVGGGGYQATSAIRVSTELSYADNPWNDKDVKGLLRLTYSYNNVKGAAQ